MLRLTSVPVSSSAPSQSIRAPCARRVVFGERPPHGGDADDRERDVEPELPLPREQVDEHRAVQRTPHPSHRLDRAERAQGACAPALRIDVADHGERDRHHRATAEGGEHTADEEPSERGVHVRGERDQDRSEHEQRVGAEERASSAEHVADATGDRHHGHEGDEVGVDDPGRVVEAVGQYQSEVADDRAQHRRHDGEVVGGDEHAEADDGEDRRR